MRYKLMYFADSIKVDLDIAGNCETESMRSVAVLVGHKEGKGRETARRLRLRWRGGGGGGWNSRLGRPIVRHQNRHTTQAIVWRSLDSLRKQAFLLAHRR